MSFTTFRDSLQQGIYKVIDPAVRFFIKQGLTPNMVTTTGLILNICVAGIYISGAEWGQRADLRYLAWAGGLTLFAGVFDMLDGQVARIGGMKSTFGALYDSVLDRYSEMIMLLGICYYLIAHRYFYSSLAASVSMIGSVMVSYTRARSEGLGIQNKGGFMQRPERVVLIGLSSLICGIIGHIVPGDGKRYLLGSRFYVETMSIFSIPLAIMAILTNITALQRLFGAKVALDALDQEKSK